MTKDAVNFILNLVKKADEKLHKQFKKNPERAYETYHKEMTRIMLEY